MPNTSQNKLPQLKNNCGNSSSHETALTSTYFTKETLTAKEALTVIQELKKRIRLSGKTFQQIKSDTAFAVFFFYELVELNPKMRKKVKESILPYKILFSLLEQIELNGFACTAKKDANKALLAITENEGLYPYSLLTEDISELKEITQNSIFVLLKLMETESVFSEYLYPLKILNSVLDNIVQIISNKNTVKLSDSLTKLTLQHKDFYSQNLLLNKN